jgi:phosphoribosylformylglycinamidine synthase
MAFAGEVGADVTQLGTVDEADEVLLFSESTTRFIAEVRPDNSRDFENLFSGLPCRRIGQTVKDQRLRIAGVSGEWRVWRSLSELKEAWQKPLRW